MAKYNSMPNSKTITGMLKYAAESSQNLIILLEYIFFVVVDFRKTNICGIL